MMMMNGSKELRSRKVHYLPSPSGTKIMLHWDVQILPVTSNPVTVVDDKGRVLNEADYP